MRIVNNVHAHLCAVEDIKHRVQDTFQSRLDKDLDFTTLTKIRDGACTGSLTDLKDSFNYAIASTRHRTAFLCIYEYLLITAYIPG